MARIAILLVSMLLAAQAAAAPFAMITDLKGQAWAMDGAQPKKLVLLGYIENPTEVKVDPNGKVAITYFANGVQYSFAGPARVALEIAAPKVIDGQAGEFKKVTPEKAIGGGLSSDQWRRLQQATVVMRNVKSTFAVVGPDKTSVLERSPEYEWNSVSGATGYRLVIYGPDNEILQEVTTEQNSLRPALELESGKRYRWKVDALGMAKPVSATGNFTVADDAARERSAEMKRSAGSELGARSFYATILEAEGHTYDARTEWKALAKDYPNEPAIVSRSR
jgi:hypothetical protein